MLGTAPVAGLMESQMTVVHKKVGCWLFLLAVLCFRGASAICGGLTGYPLLKTDVVAR